MNSKPPNKKGHMVPIRFNAADYAEAKAFCGKEPLSSRIRHEFLRIARSYRKGRHPSLDEQQKFEMRVMGLLSKSRFPEAARKLLMAVQEGRMQLDEIEHAMLINACANIDALRKEMLEDSRVKDDEEQ